MGGRIGGRVAPFGGRGICGGMVVVAIVLPFNSAMEGVAGAISSDP